MKNTFLICLSLFLLHSCSDNNTLKIDNWFDKKENAATPNDKLDNQPVKSEIEKTYYTDGTIKTEISYTNNKRNGPAKSYYENGQISIEMEYKDNLRHGKTIWYRRDGSKIKSTSFYLGKQTGFLTLYYPDGQKRAEIPYRNGHAVPGLKEYNENGKAMNAPVPEIIIEEKNKIIEEGKFILEFTLSPEQKKANYYYFKQTMNNDSVPFEIPINNGVGSHIFHLRKGQSVNERFTVFAKTNSPMGHLQIISKTVQVHLENAM